MKKEHRWRQYPPECDAHLRERSYTPCSFYRGGPVLSLGLGGGSRPRGTDRTAPLETGSPSPPAQRHLNPALFAWSSGSQPDPLIQLLMLQ